MKTFHLGEEAMLADHAPSSRTGGDDMGYLKLVLQVEHLLKLGRAGGSVLVGGSGHGGQSSEREAQTKPIAEERK